MSVGAREPSPGFEEKGALNDVWLRPAAETQVREEQELRKKKRGETGHREASAVQRAMWVLQTYLGVGWGVKAFSSNTQTLMCTLQPLPIE